MARDRVVSYKVVYALIPVVGYSYEDEGFEQMIQQQIGRM